MKRTAIGAGAYVDLTGVYWARPWVNGRRTWRKLKAQSVKKAIREANSTEYTATADTLAELAEQWKRAGYPGRKRTPKSTVEPENAMTWLLKFFGKMRSDEIRLKHLPDYAKWRSRFIKRGMTNAHGIKGGRTIDVELKILSNICHYGVKQGILEINYIHRARDRYQAEPRHAYKVMPPNAETIHQIAGEFLTGIKSEVMAWLTFFSEFTGLRHSELLRLDLSAKPEQAGYIHWFSKSEITERTDGMIGQMHLGQRSKDGINPYSEIGPEFGEMIRAFLNWHRQRFGLGKVGQPRWFFPGRHAAECLFDKSFNHAIARVTRALDLPHITPHGFRAYFATKHMRDGKRSVDIAYDMGDRTVELVERIYVNNIKGPKLWWVPADGLPAWHGWLPQNKNKVDSLRTTAKKSLKSTSGNPIKQRLRP